MYDYMFEWLKTATKQERHCDEIETFAKKHPLIFMKYHMYCKGIVQNDINTENYQKSKENMIKLFDSNKDDFKPVFEAVKRMKGIS